MRLARSLPCWQPAVSNSPTANGRTFTGNNHEHVVADTVRCHCRRPSSMVGDRSVQSDHELGDQCAGCQLTTGRCADRCRRRHARATVAQHQEWRRGPGTATKSRGWPDTGGRSSPVDDSCAVRSGRGRRWTHVVGRHGRYPIARRHGAPHTPATGRPCSQRGPQWAGQKCRAHDCRRRSDRGGSDRWWQRRHRAHRRRGGDRHYRPCLDSIVTTRPRAGPFAPTCQPK